tara:strand:+ start:2606 stop:2911 length:306 start_codon:yes stop_codon:yes gene_type:complete
MDNLTKDERYLKARERVREEKKFYTSLLSAFFTIAIVAAVNYYINEFRNPWFLWVVFGLGISVIFKAIKIFNVIPFMGRDWEQKKIRELMNEEDTVNKKWK